MDPTGHEPQDGYEIRFQRNQKDLMEGRITPQEFQARQDARAYGAMAGLAVVGGVFAAIRAPQIAGALLTWAARNPQTVQTIGNEAVQMSQGNPMSSPASPVSKGKALVPAAQEAYESALRQSMTNSGEVISGIAVWGSKRLVG